MRTTPLLKTALAGAVALLAACKDSTGNDVGPGSLSFTYAGDRAGTYTASGQYRPTSSSFQKQPFAVGVRAQQSGQNVLALLSYQPTTAATGNMVLFGLPNVTGTGSYPLADNSCNTDTCPLALLLFDTNPDLEEDNSQVFTFTSGTLNVTSSTGGRMTGSFSGTAETFFGDSVITVTGGTFDIPVRSGSFITNRALSKRTQSRHARPEE